MFKVKMNHRAEIKASITSVNIAKENIRHALVGWRNDTITEIKKYLNDDTTWEFPHEHAPGAYARNNSYQTRQAHGADHFKFPKYGQPSGGMPIYAFSVENNSPDNVGNFILGGVQPPSEPMIGPMAWKHGSSEPGFAGTISPESRSAISGRAEEFQAEFAQIAKEEMHYTTVGLKAIGDLIFKGTSTFLQRGDNREGWEDTQEPIFS